MRSLFVLALALLGSAPLGKGDKAPDFTATDTDGKVHVLSRAVQEHTVVLAFFPKAFTLG